METDGDGESRLSKAISILLRKYRIAAGPQDIRACCLLAELLCRRTARLYACGIAALCRKQGLQRCVVAVDGSVFEKYSKFREHEYLRYRRF